MEEYMVLYHVPQKDYKFDDYCIDDRFGRYVIYNAMTFEVIEVSTNELKSGKYALHKCENDIRFYELLSFYEQICKSPNLQEYLNKSLLFDMMDIDVFHVEMIKLKYQYPGHKIEDYMKNVLETFTAAQNKRVACFLSCRSKNDMQEFIQQY